MIVRHITHLSGLLIGCVLVIAAATPSARAAGPPAAIIPQGGPIVAAKDADVPAGPPALTIHEDTDDVARVWLRWDTGALHLFFRVVDSSPLQNSGDNERMLFKTGDSVDLQIGMDPNAPPNRAQPVPGDLRRELTKLKQGPVAILFRYRVPGTLAPVEYGSPTGHATVDRVDRLTTAKIRTALTEDGYTLAADVPWDTLAKGFAPKPGMTLSGDAGVLFSDPDGGTTVERDYWSNKDTVVVADVPTEVSIHPGKWGSFILK